MRRPNMMLFTPYMIECANSITGSGMISTSNASLLAWVRLFNVGEEISAAYQLHHMGTSSDDISDRRLLQIINTFDPRLQKWFVNNEGPAMHGE